MKKSNLIRIMLVILVFIWVGLKGQKTPEIIPFRLVPLNYEDNQKIELGIEKNKMVLFETFLRSFFKSTLKFKISI